MHEEKYLIEDNTMRKSENCDFSTKPTIFYNLEMIMAIGYCV